MAQFLTGTDGSGGPGDLVKASVVNSGIIAANGSAAAGGRLNQAATYAEANADAFGIVQQLRGAGVETAAVTNSGLIRAVASASSDGHGNSDSEALAVGISQDFSGVSDEHSSVLNTETGFIEATARAKALGTGDMAAGAFAIGIAATDFGPPGINFDVSIVNRGQIKVAATASGSGDEFARAAGVFVNTEGPVGGLIKNTGSIYARAVANHGGAGALGIFESSTANNTHIVNNGLIHVYAQGIDPHATAIGVGGFAPGPAGFKTVITNDGDLWAGISTDKGKTIKRGNAINTKSADGEGPAPSPVLIQLIDATPSHVFGNIDITAADAISITKGTTFLDGEINPDHLLEGNLDVFTTGKLVLQNHDPVNGPSGVWIDTYTNHVNGTLGIELTPSTDPADYPHIIANTANLRGTLFAGFTPGVYGKHLVYEDVIDANVRNGLYDQVLDNSALLQTRARYDGAGNVDLIVDRLAFSAVQGLSASQKSIAQTLDAASASPGGLAGVIGDLFALDATAYAQALNALSGAEFAQLDQSILWSTGQLNSTVTDRMDCGANWAASASGQEDKRCFVPGRTQVWARVHGSWNNNGGDGNAPGYDESQQGIFGGADHAFANNWFVGLAGGYFTSDMGFDNWSGAGGSSIDYSGMQAALYGGYDDGAWYARGIGSFGLYSGDSHRLFGLTTTPIDPNGSFDASVESFYGEVGHRYAVMSETMATPFLGIGVAHSNVGGFTESDPNGSGAALTVGDASGDSLASVVGARVTGHWGGWKPELSVAWQHEYLDTVQTVHNSLVAAPGAPGFTASSSDPGRDWALVGLGSAYSFNPTSEFMLKYDGRFASDYTSHSVVARWDTHF